MTDGVTMRGCALAFGLLAACAGGDTGDSGPNGACGDVTTHEVSVAGRVVDASGQNVAAAAVELQDRAWNPGAVLGHGVTDAQGRFELLASDVTSVEDCWGSLLDYYLVASEGARSGERAMNSPLFNAIDGGTFEVDVSAAPIVVAP